MREFVNIFVSGYRVDDGENDVVMLCAVGPRGGTRSIQVLTPDQARTARDQLDLALTRFADARARQPRYIVVENAGYEGERDAQDCANYQLACEWMTSKYSPEEIEAKHMAICRDVAGERSYEL
jgi:hypothetical protein